MPEEDLNALIFQLKAAEYRATLADAAFEALVAAKPKPDPAKRESQTALVSEVMYAVAREHAFELPSLGHLVRALGEEERFAEAAQFCERWLELAPSDSDALVFRAVLACRTCDFSAADRAFRRLRDLGTADGILWGIDTMILLSFSDGSKSAQTARAMLDAGCNKSWALPLAADAAMRTGDAGLLVRVARLDPTLLDETPARQHQVLRILRLGLLGLLSDRAAAP